MAHPPENISNASKEPTEDKYPEVLRYLRDSLTEILTGQGVQEDLARLTAQTSVEYVREQWQGMSIYIPKCHPFRIEQRDRDINKKWKGTNRQALCQEYGITEQRLYQILARLRLEQIARRQRDRL